jgi:phosphatidylglycerophosphate synthase
MSDFQYEKTLKTKSKKDFLNFQNYLLVGARGITRFLYHTPVTPHQVIFLSMVLGIISSFLIIKDDRTLVFIGALCLFYKNVLDKVDGSLARAKGLVSRRGRFYDSLSDFIVSFALFAAIGVKLNQVYNNAFAYLICFIALLVSMFQCSFFIYYQVAFIKFSGKNTINRLIETVTDEDLQNQDKFTILLQRIFMLIYGWQDILVAKIDGFLRARLVNTAVKAFKSSDPVSEFIRIWYLNPKFLSICSILSIGSHMFLIALFAVIGSFEYYLFFNLVILNVVLLVAIFYHYYSAKKSVKLRDKS